MEKRKKVGMFIGKFLPPHIGHTTQIEKCLKFVDVLYVIVADSKKRSKVICKNAGIKTISINRRIYWLKKHFKGNKKIKVLKLNQGMLEAYPNKIDEWKKKLERLVKGRAQYWFVDNEFINISRKVFPEYEFIGFNRKKINISATMVREDLKGNIDYIIKEAKNYFSKI
ncbi:MAG: adenylyltransferase/cytidyltransferase family protein [Clostridia bacterium]|nr:adenylyltransferase/cytidyltransferase family protein [Clostridia bacterium]